MLAGLLTIVVVCVLGVYCGFGFGWLLRWVLVLWWHLVACGLTCVLVACLLVGIVVGLVPCWICLIGCFDLWVWWYCVCRFNSVDLC